MVERIPNAEAGVAILFSSGPFPGYQHEFTWRREEYGGNWHHSPKFGIEGCCAQVVQVFRQGPERIFAQVKAKNG